MAFERPSLATIIERIRTDIEGKLVGADAHLRRVVEDVLAIALGGAAHLLHGHLVWLSRQLFPDTAEKEYLERWASMRSLSRKTAVKASGLLPITGTPGSPCPAGTIWQRADGTRYVQNAEVTIGGDGTATIALTAEAAGAGGNAIAGVKLSLVSPVAGVGSAATLTGAGLSGGSDTENDEELLARLLARMRTPPRGGGTGDYVSWALEVAGVTRAWELPQYYGTGTLVLLFVRDQDANIIPDVAEVSAVQAHLETKAPPQAAVTALAPIPKVVHYTIHISPDTTAVRAAVQAELADLHAMEAVPGGTWLISHVREAISRATGETDHVLTVPATDVTCTALELAVMGTVTWV